MVKRMLVDATHPEETRVAVVDSNRNTNRLEDLDYALASKPILRGNIYLAKVMRVEPSLQAAFVEYGGNRHGFLPFSEIHPDYFRIPVADRDQLACDDENMDIQDQMDSEEELVEGTDDDEQLKAEGDETLAVDEEQQETEESAAPPLTAFARPLDDDDDDSTLGLITDFGNAIVDNGSLTEVQTPQTPPENVGGDSPERIVRNHRPRYNIQEVLKRGQVMLIQVVKEERGGKGAALTTFLSLAGRYCVLMPNTDHGGGVSRKITNHQDRRRMKEILDQLEIPDGMAVILRTAGMEQEPPEIQRDLGYLLSMWDNIREQTLQSSAPALIYEEANLIKRSLRDLYRQGIDEILVAGKEGFERSRDFMCALLPDEVEKMKLYEDSTPLFIRYQVENQIDALHNPVVQLRSGGYLVINPTEALVSIDVNSGRATRERHIEETAVKTNLEAADEIARQLRLRDLAGLVVIDFIDMEDGRNNAAVERRVKEAMKNDRARLQIGRISPFGLLELSRQRLRPSLVEINFEKCPHCSGMGYIRSADSAALSILRAIEEEALKGGRIRAMIAHMPARLAIYILNHKRKDLSLLEGRYGITVTIHNDETLPLPSYKIEKIKGQPGASISGPAVDSDQVIAEVGRDRSAFVAQPHVAEDTEATSEDTLEQDETTNGSAKRRFRSRDRRPRNRQRPRLDKAAQDIDEKSSEPSDRPLEAASDVEGSDESADDANNTRRRRRGRRGGRRRNNERNGSRAPTKVDTVSDQPHQEVFVPTSIHEIDTTPKPTTSPSASSTENRQRKAELPRPPSYEVINPPTEHPKGGWWKRLTGQ